MPVTLLLTAEMIIGRFEEFSLVKICACHRWSSLCPEGDMLLSSANADDLPRPTSTSCRSPHATQIACGEGVAPAF